MQKEIISGKQAMSILSLILTACGILNYTAMGNVDQNLWISLIFAAILVIPLYFMYCRLVKLFPNHGFFEIIEISFGRLVGKIITIIFIWFGLHISAIVLNRTAGFIKISSLPETPLLFIAIMLTLVCLIGLKCGLEVIARCAQIFFWIILAFTVMALLFSLGNIHPENLLPIMFDSWKPVFEGTFLLAVLPLGHVILFSVVLHSVKESDSKKKVMFGGGAIAVVILVLLFIRNVMVLGMQNIKSTLYPAFASAGLVNIGGFIRSVEIFIAIYYLINTLFLIMLSTYFALKGLQKLFNLNHYRKLVTPTVFFVMALMLTLFKDTGEMNEFYTVFCYYMMPFEFILPVLIYIAAKIKTKKLKSKRETYICQDRPGQ